VQYDKGPNFDPKFFWKNFFDPSVWASQRIFLGSEFWAEIFLEKFF